MRLERIPLAYGFVAELRTDEERDWLGEVPLEREGDLLDALATADVPTRGTAPVPPIDPRD